MNKKILLLIFLLVIFGAVVAGADEELKPVIFINGIEVYFPDQQPVLDENHQVIVPVLFVSADLGAEVEWLQETKQIRITRGEDEILLTQFKKEYYLNGVKHVLDTAVTTKNNRTMLPLHFIVERLGGKMTSDGSNIYITYEKDPGTSLLIYPAVFFVFMFFWTIGLFFRERKDKKKAALTDTDIKEGIIDSREVELRYSFFKRVVKPFVSKTASILNRFLPTDRLKNIELQLYQAGNPRNFTASEFFNIKIILAALFSLAAYLSPLGSWFLPGFFMLGWYLPGLYLKSLKRKRWAEIEKTFPDIIDLLTVGVEAGLSFDGAIAKVAEKSSGILGLEFRRVLQENKMGKKRKEALKDMAKRLGDENITSFITAVIQAEQLGISFNKMLRLQSAQVRHKRKQRVEEAAMKAPVKMLVPLIFFIFPTIFIVLLGPAAIRIFEIFMEMQF